MYSESCDKVVGVYQIHIESSSVCSISQDDVDVHKTYCFDLDVFWTLLQGRKIIGFVSLCTMDACKFVGTITRLAFSH